MVQLVSGQKNSNKKRKCWFENTGYYLLLLHIPRLWEKHHLFFLLWWLRSFLFRWKCVLNTFTLCCCTVDERRAQKYLCTLPIGMHNSSHNRSTLSLVCHTFFIRVIRCFKFIDSYSVTTLFIIFFHSQGYKLLLSKHDLF